MTFASASQFHVYWPWVNAWLALCLKSVLNVKAQVGAFNQEKALVGAFSVIVQPVVEPMDSFTALSSQAAEFSHIFPVASSWEEINDLTQISLPTNELLIL